MGLLTGYKDVTANVRYYIGFELEGATFRLSDEIGTEDSVLALRVSRALLRSGIVPKISRGSRYIDAGYILEEPHFDEVTIEKLEQIVKSKELPKKIFAIVQSKY